MKLIALLLAFDLVQLTLRLLVFFPLSWMCWCSRDRHGDLVIKTKYFLNKFQCALSGPNIIRLHKRVIWGLINPCWSLWYSAEYYAVWSLWILTLIFLWYSLGFFEPMLWIPGYFSLTRAVLSPNLPFIQLIWAQAHTEALGSPVSWQMGGMEILVIFLQNGVRQESQDDQRWSLV